MKHLELMLKYSQTRGNASSNERNNVENNDKRNVYYIIRADQCVSMHSLQ